MDINPLAEQWKKRGLLLHDHQKEGVEEMYGWYKAGHGGINGDEMGLGKTCQAVVVMMRLMKEVGGPFLVVCPLSVCGHWVSEIQRFSCDELDPVGYFGYGEQRANVLKNLGKLKRNTVFIIPYHLFRNESAVVTNLQVESRLKFDVVVVDEAHAIKNQNSLLSENLKPYRSHAWFLLMTGTPIQNNLHELYTLLTFVDSNKFCDTILSRDSFVSKYKKTENIDRLKEILSTYMIRRTKDAVCKNLPSCDQVIIYHNLTELQKKLYLDIISKDYDKLISATGGKNHSLINLHMQLRKCVAHPYLFAGIEPEPFVEGEHIVEASGKFQVLDRLLLYLKANNHRCLIFTQFRILLDILEDFMNFRGYNYERIDGSIRAEERYAAINNFQTYATKEQIGPWCFLLTTGSGGVGLNLTGADTVVFLDADWNPQNDIQAMARCHRIGQNRSVRVIRLIGRYTIEQHMHARIRDKLKFTDMVMGNGEMKLAAFDMLDMIKQSLATLKEQKNTKYQLTDEELETVIGKTDECGEWLPIINNKENQIPAELRLDPDEVDKMDTDCSDYRVFEGHSYRVSAKDEAAFEELRHLQLSKKVRYAKRSCPQRRDDENQMEGEETAAGLREIQHARMVAAEKRKLAVQEKKAALWSANNYVSYNLTGPVSDESADNQVIEEGSALWYVHGDVTMPKRNEEDKTTKCLIVHCVDNSGKFGRRGIFNSLRGKDPSIAERYELIARMGDLKLGNSHLITDVSDQRVLISDVQQPSTSLNRSESVILIVAQDYKHRDIIRPLHLEQCFSRVGNYARQNNASVHMARIGYGTSLSWYTVERLIKKHIANYGVPTYIYHAEVNYRPTSPKYDRISPYVSPEDSSPQSKRRKIPRGSKDLLEECDNETSTDSGSTNEDEWSEEDETSEEYSASDEEFDDEGPGELNVQYTPREQRRRTRKWLNIEDDRESVSEQVLTNSCFSTLEKDPDEYCTPKRLELFIDVAVSLYGLQEGEIAELMDAIVANGGYVISDLLELKDATHAVVPPEIIADRQEFVKFRMLFSADCVFIVAKWIMDSVGAGELLDTVAYSACSI